MLLTIVERLINFVQNISIQGYVSIHKAKVDLTKYNQKYKLKQFKDAT